MTVEIGARIAETAAQNAARELPQVSQGLWKRLGSALGFGKDEVQVATAAIKQAPSWLHSLAERYRLFDAPQLLAHLPALAKVVGDDAVKQAAAKAGSNRGLFELELVALAERGGYKDLAGLQGAIPHEHIVMDGCPFCKPAQLFRPDNSILAESANFSVGPTITPLYTTGEHGGHVMVFPRHHRSVVGGLPEPYQQEFMGLADATKTAMEKQYGQPVSVISNGLPGYGYDPRSPYDTHAHAQLFTGNADIAKATAGFFGWSKADMGKNIHPVGGWNDYFNLYQQGLLRERYIVSLDGSGKGSVIVIGGKRTGSGFARRMVAQSVKLVRDLERYPSVVDEPAARKIANELRGKIKVPAGKTP